MGHGKVFPWKGFYALVPNIRREWKILLETLAFCAAVREPLVKEKVHYSWPACANNVEVGIYFFY
jgi:hypothetical protein